MGCKGSKQARRDRCRRSSPLYVKSYSLPVNDPGGATTSRQRGDDAFALASTHDHDHHRMERPEQQEHFLTRKKEKEEDAVGGAKFWSGMIEHRSVPKMPIVTPSNEPETIDVRELMAGLEDDSPLHHVASLGDSRRAFSFEPSLDAFSRSSSPESKEEGSIISDFDVEKLLPEQLSSLCRSPEPEKKTHYRKKIESSSVTTGECRVVTKPTGIVQARVNAFQQKIDHGKANTVMTNAAKVAPRCKSPPDSKKKVVFYFTSLRGVRQTYEDCWTTKVILKGYGVRVDERDVSMHGGFKEELIDLLGPGYGGNRLPAVFVDGHYLGGAEEVQHFHEAGELGKALEGCERAPLRKNGSGGEVACEGCEDVRFVPCRTCWGSCKVYAEEEEEEEEEEVDLGGFRRCSDCNENGLVRCSLCC